MENVKKSYSDSNDADGECELDAGNDVTDICRPLRICSNSVRGSKGIGLRRFRLSQINEGVTRFKSVF